MYTFPWVELQSYLPMNRQFCYMSPMPLWASPFRGIFFSAGIMECQWGTQEEGFRCAWIDSDILLRVIVHNPSLQYISPLLIHSHCPVSLVRRRASRLISADQNKASVWLHCTLVTFQKTSISTAGGTWRCCGVSSSTLIPVTIWNPHWHRLCSLNPAQLWVSGLTTHHPLTGEPNFTKPLENFVVN